MQVLVSYSRRKEKTFKCTNANNEKLQNVYIILPVYFIFGDIHAMTKSR